MFDCNYYVILILFIILVFMCVVYKVIYRSCSVIIVYDDSVNVYVDIKV